MKHHTDLEGHQGSVLALLYVNNERVHIILSASADSTVRGWDAKTLKPLWTITPPNESFGDILSLAFLDGRIVFGCQSCAILVGLASDSGDGEG